MIYLIGWFFLISSESSKWCAIVCKIQTIILKLTHSDDAIAKIVSDYNNIQDEEKFVALYKCMVYYLSQTDNIPVQHMQLVSNLTPTWCNSLFIQIQQIIVS